jgi:predicted PurR-regulated permease PerM
MRRFLVFAITGVGLMAGYFALTRVWLLISWACLFAIITLPFVFVFFHKSLSKRFGWVWMIASFFVLSWILSIGAVGGHFNNLAEQVYRYQDSGLEAPAPLLHDLSSDTGRPFVYVFGWSYMAFTMPFALLAYLAVSIFKSLSRRFKAHRAITDA